MLIESRAPFSETLMQLASDSAMKPAKRNVKRRASTKETLHLKSETTETPGATDTTEIATKIARAAYYLAEQRGFAPGHELDDWLAAERQLLELHS